MNASDRNPPDAARTLNRSREGEDPERRRRRLAFRSWHRGTREADLLLGSFADRHLGGFDATALDQFEAILERADPDIYNWMSAREAPPPELDGPVLRALMAHRYPLKS
ncbi:MAG: succinate dehydrogenase assembly factor 2 [Azospirillaceae bacterium]